MGVGAVVGAYSYASSASPAGARQGAPAAAGLELPPPAGLLVDVVGAVARPGLYRVARGDRAYDAIAAAGGLSADADPSCYRFALRRPPRRGLPSNGAPH